MKNNKQARKNPLFVLALDILCIGVILCIFSLFHHVIPAMKARREVERKSQEMTVPSATPIPISTPTPAPTPAPIETTPTPEPVEVLPPAPQCQFPFKDVFTDEVVVTENSYTSPNLALHITSHEEDLGHGPLRWYVCDVYIADIRNLSTVLAYDMFKYQYDEPILNMMTRKNAIFALSGDSCLRQVNSLVVRNSFAYNTVPTAADVCLLYKDGTMEVSAKEDLNVDVLLAQEGERALYQSWHFGPSLLNEEGQPKESYGNAFDQYVLLENLNPRAGIGYYEPGHYCMIVADGRGESAGATMRQFASLFAREGCTLAYNLDGGRMAQMAFNGQMVNQPSNGGNHPQSDAICLIDFDATALEEETP